MQKKDIEIGGGRRSISENILNIKVRKLIFVIRAYMVYGCTLLSILTDLFFCGRSFSSLLNPLSFVKELLTLC